MESSRGSKRSSISFGSYQRQPAQNAYMSGGYDSMMFPSGPTSGGGGPASANNSSYYASRSPMYSPLDYSQSFFPGNGYSQLHQFRGPNSTDSPLICEYEANYPLFAVDWSAEDYVCLGSYIEGSKNRLQVIKSVDMLSWNKVAECNVTFPVSNIQWHPGRPYRKKFATCSDSLRIWDINEDENGIYEQINLSVCKYNKQQNIHNTRNTPKNSNSNESQGTIAGHSSLLGELPPITSFHWNSIDTNLLISSSIDTTCIVWDLQSSNYVKTQLIAHDSEVFDVRFLAQSTQLFASCGGDGSVRVFDLRCLAHSTIIYEPCDLSGRSNNGSETTNINTTQDASAPHRDIETAIDYSSKALLRLEPSPFDPNVIATFALDSNSILILDMRNPGSPILTLEGHKASVNQIKWHPTRRNVILSCSDDCQVLYWDINKWLDGTPSSTSSSTTNNSPSKSPFTHSNSSSMAGLPAEELDPAVSKWNTRNNSQSLETPTMFYANRQQEINNIVWRPQDGEWFGAISAKQFQNVKI